MNAATTRFFRGWSLVEVLAPLLRPLLDILTPVPPTAHHPQLVDRTRIAAFNSDELFRRLKYRGPPAAPFAR